MFSFPINPTALLEGSLSKELGRLGKDILSTGFSRELHAQRESLAGAGSHSPGSENNLTPEQQDLLRSVTRVLSDTGESDPRPSRDLARETMLDNPVVVQKILARLGAPAEARSACLEAQDEQGRISLRDLLTALARCREGSQGKLQGSPEGPAPPAPTVTAREVKELAQAMAPGNEAMAEALKKRPLKKDGTYNVEELLEWTRSLVEEGKAFIPSKKSRTVAPEGAPVQTIDASSRETMTMPRPNGRGIPPEAAFLNLAGNLFPGLKENPREAIQLLANRMDGLSDQEQEALLQDIRRLLESRPSPAKDRESFPARGDGLGIQEERKLPGAENPVQWETVLREGSPIPSPVEDFLAKTAEGRNEAIEDAEPEDVPADLSVTTQALAADPLEDPGNLTILLAALLENSGEKPSPGLQLPREPQGNNGESTLPVAPPEGSSQGTKSRGQMDSHGSFGRSPLAAPSRPSAESGEFPLNLPASVVQQLHLPADLRQELLQGADEKGRIPLQTLVSVLTKGESPTMPSSSFEKSSFELSGSSRENGSAEPLAKAVRTSRGSLLEMDEKGRVTTTARALEALRMPDVLRSRLRHLADEDGRIPLRELVGELKKVAKESLPPMEGAAKEVPTASPAFSGSRISVEDVRGLLRDAEAAHPAFRGLGNRESGAGATEGPQEPFARSQPREGRSGVDSRYAEETREWLRGILSSASTPKEATGLSSQSLLSEEGTVKEAPATFTRLSEQRISVEDVRGVLRDLEAAHPAFRGLESKASLPADGSLPLGQAVEKIVRVLNAEAPIQDTRPRNSGAEHSSLSSPGDRPSQAENPWRILEGKLVSLLQGERLGEGDGKHAAPLSTPTRGGSPDGSAPQNPGNQEASQGKTGVSTPQASSSFQGREHGGETGDQGRRQEEARIPRATAGEGSDRPAQPSAPRQVFAAAMEEAVTEREVRSPREASMANPVSEGEAAAPSQAIHRPAAGPASSPKSPPPPLDFQQKEWPEQLARQVESLHRENRHRIAIEVEPKELGRLVLHIETDHRQVHAWISADHDQAKELLMQNAQALREALSQQGLTLGQFSVNVGQGKEGRQFFAQHQGNKRKARASGGMASSASSAGIPSNDRRSPRGEHAINLVA